MVLDTGNTGFMLLATSLVMLMTPGLAFFYGGLVGRKNVLTIMMQSFVSLCWTSILWFLFGYSLCFSGDFHGIVGNLDHALMRGIDINDFFGDGASGIPIWVFVSYQMMFAIITPALITGAFTNRVTFKSYLIFLTVWLTFLYFPFTHMVWGGGIMADWGVRDFAGGIVVHNTAGIAALAAVFFVGARKVKEPLPHSIPLVALGTGLLWFGWYGFNAGSELAVDAITAQAFINTDIAASFAGMTWLVIAWIHEGKPKFVGLLTGSVAGLATITPCAGFVTLGSAVIIGIVAGGVCYLAISIKNARGWDDALDVWGVHGIGGITGSILLGVFGSLSVNAALGHDGIINGGGFDLLGPQLLAVLIATVYSFVFTYGMLWLINKITPVRVTDVEQTLGVDDALHGEIAYDDKDPSGLVDPAINTESSSVAVTPKQDGGKKRKKKN